MTTQTISLHALKAIFRAIDRVNVVVQDEDRFHEFMTCFGWDVTVNAAQMDTIRGYLNVRPALDRLLDIIESIEADPASAAGKVPEIIETLINLADKVRKLGDAPVGGLPAPFDGTTSFWTDFPANLLGQLISLGLREEAPTIFGLLQVFGILRVELVRPAPEPGRLAFARQVVDWSALGTLVTDPTRQLKSVFNWDTPAKDFDFSKILIALGLLADAARFPARLTAPTDALLDQYYSPTNPARPLVRSLAIPFALHIHQFFEDFSEIGLQVVPIPAEGDPGGKPTGLVVTPIFNGNLADFGSGAGGFSLVVKGQSFQDQTFKIEFWPGTAHFVLNPGLDSIDAEIGLQGSFSPPKVLIGTASSSRVETEGVFFSLQVRGSAQDPELILKIGTGADGNPAKLRFVLQLDSGDGFLQKILGSAPQQVEFSGSISFSSKHGIGLNGNIGLQIALPLHLNLLGVLELETLTLGTRPNESGGADFPLGLTFKANLGPLRAVIDAIGIVVMLKQAPKSEKAGLLGNLSFDLAFKPPNGVGLSINAGAVSGGGYLFFDYAREEYGGVLQLDLAKIVTVTAIGLITTRMPDGSKGFSLLIIITAEFGTGIQLGFGFTLLGVGGLLGLNRTMNLQALALGVRNGALNNIMFPHDVIANAPRIISDLRSFFPPENGKFLIGPMVKLGWGTPTLVSLSLGIIIEIPGNIAIVGVLRVALPTNDAALIVLQVSFIGALEFDKSRAWFFATLFESRVLFFTLEGDMGLLMAFGNDAVFVLSVGGFHPQFNPPPLPFPGLRRISFSILSTPVQRIRVEGYFAVTSNTVQFGANAEIVLGFDDFGLEGHIGFDVLIQFSPFYFIAQISASVSLKAFGIGLFSVRLSFALSGPSGWRARGSGSISLLFFDISADFDISWGEAKDTSLPPIPVIPLLTGELNKPQNWKAELPTTNNLLVSLRTLDPTTDLLVLHPVGTLRVSQKALPLDLNIDKVGNQKPSDAKRFSIEVSTGGLGKAADATEQFAIAQYQDMDDATKLSRPSYQQLNGGVQLSVAGQQLKSSHAVRRIIRYEQIIIDNNFKRFRKRFSIFASVLFAHFLGGAAVTKSVLSVKYKLQYQPFDDKIAVAQEGYTVAYQANNKAYATAATFASEAAAHDFMQQLVADDPNRTETLHVIPQFEVTP